MEYARAIAVLQISVVILQVALFVILLVILKLMRKDLEQHTKTTTTLPPAFKYTKETMIKGGPPSEKQNKDSYSISSDTGTNGSSTAKTNTEVSQSIYS